MRTRFLSLLLLPAAAACAGAEQPRAAAAADIAGEQAALPTSVPRFVDDVRAEVPEGDGAAEALARFLELSLVDAAGDPEARLELLACAMAHEPALPAELLATYEISGRGGRGDTAVVRARVVTVAEQERARGDASRYAAAQRVRRGEWEWELVREDGVWRVCSGPTFGFVGDAALTTWRPDGASLETARELAASLRAGALP